MKTISSATPRRVSMAALRATAKLRPEGYLEEVMRSGRIENDVLFLEDQIYRDLQRKYSSGDAKPRIIANATGAAFRLAKAAMKGEIVRASASEVERRLAICKTCEFFVDNPMKCRKCGCFLSLKARLETEHCPIAKW